MNSRAQILRRKRTTSRRPMPDLFSNVDDIRPTDRRSNRSNTMFSYFCSQGAEDQKSKRISILPKRILIKNWSMQIATPRTKPVAKYRGWTRLRQATRLSSPNVLRQGRLRIDAKMSEKDQPQMNTD